MNVNLFGATGLVGGYLLKECLANEAVEALTIFVRKPLPLQHPKLKQVITDFDSLAKVAHEIKADVVFNCLGTTIKVAGSEAAQYQIDCLYPVKVAQLAAQNGVRCMVNVSSVGASLSGNFYLKTKAEMEKGVAEAIGKKAYFLRPSFLVGERADFRFWEKVGIFSFVAINPLLMGGLKKFKSINAQDVAKAMLTIAIQQPENSIFEYENIQQFVD